VRSGDDSVGLGSRFLQAFCNSGGLPAQHAVDGGAADQIGRRQMDSVTRQYYERSISDGVVRLDGQVRRC